MKLFTVQPARDQKSNPLFASSQVHEVEGPGCCACFGKVFCSIVLAILLLLVAALSAIAVATGRFQFWTFLSGNDVSPSYILRCAHMLFSCDAVPHAPQGALWL